MSFQLGPNPDEPKKLVLEKIFLDESVPEEWIDNAPKQTTNPLYFISKLFYRIEEENIKPDEINPYTTREFWTVLINNLRNPETGWLHYFGLTPELRVLNSLEEPVEKESNKTFTYLGYDGGDWDFKLTANINGKMTLVKLAYPWFMFSTGGNTRFNTRFFSENNYEETEEPLKTSVKAQQTDFGTKEDQFKIPAKLEKKYSDMLRFMQFFTERTNITLENLVRDYKLGLDIQPKIPLEHPNKQNKLFFSYRAIEIKIHYKNKYLASLVITDPEKRQKTHKYPNIEEMEFNPVGDFENKLKERILTKTESKMSIQEREELRKTKTEISKKVYMYDLINRVIMGAIKKEFEQNKKFKEEFKQYQKAYRHQCSLEYDRPVSDLLKISSKDFFEKNTFEDLKQFHFFLKYNKKSDSKFEKFFEDYTQLIQKYETKQKKLISVVESSLNLPITKISSSLIKKIITRVKNFSKSADSLLQEELMNLSEISQVYSFDKQLEELKEPYKTYKS
ncbi:hypothetical protein DRJ22_03340 [Candidatus Woesearchaeota archaeon]|nr:MAG: hypothetical protein DRJ22_03340 [Candidatus Woesearchaeota archaeon]